MSDVGKDREERQEPAFDQVEQLKELGELRERGILTEEEFTDEKRKVLES